MFTTTDHRSVKPLVPEDAVIDRGDPRWTGRARDAEIRAHREGGMPTVDDPTRDNGDPHA
jgi:hypothetical protein